VAVALKMLMWGCIASIAHVTFSCEEFCEEPNRTAVVVNFYDADDILKSINLTVKGIGNDSVLYPDKSIFSQILLPVNPSADMMSFSIKNDTFPPDTIIIRYTRHVGFVSSKCGCVTYAEIQEETESTGNTVLNMVVINPGVTTVSYRQGVINAENIRIYY
jgi:hypothetical protein